MIATALRAAFDVSPEQERVRLDEFIVRELDIPRAEAERLREEGRVRVDGRAVLEGSPRLTAGMRVEVLAAEADPRVLPEDLPLTIVYETDRLFVVNKPAPMAMTPGTKHPAGTLANALRGSGRPLSRVEGELRPGIVHRLDRGTSGALLVAKDDATHRALVELFAARAVARRYVALVHGAPEWDERTVDAPIAPPRPGRKAYSVQEDGRAARTRFVVRERLGAVTAVEASPQTGRTHQIRVHLAWLGHPIVGDTQYAGGADRSVWGRLGVRRSCLHAERIVFEGVTASAPLPEDFAQALERAKSSRATPSGRT